MEFDDIEKQDFIEKNKNMQIIENWLQFYFAGGFDPKPEPVKRICEYDIDSIVDEFSTSGYDWLDED